jgi:hypothetical protein
LPILADFANAVIWNRPHFSINTDGEGKMVALFHVQGFQWLELHGIDDTVMDSNLEIALAERFIPADAAQQLPDRFHAEMIATREDAARFPAEQSDSA